VITAADALPVRATAPNAKTNALSAMIDFRDREPWPPRKDAALIESLELMPPRPTQPAAIAQAKRTGSAENSAGILAVPLSWSQSLFRPVTLRRHLSAALPLSESR
jgi:hypothetical protein